MHNGTCAEFSIQAQSIDYKGSRRRSAADRCAVCMYVHGTSCFMLRGHIKYSDFC